MDAALRALAGADLGWTDDLASIWRDAPGHVPALHSETAERIAAALEAAPTGQAPLGRVVLGAQGSGKTHLLGVLRRRAWAAGGWFVALEVAGLRDFWETALQGFLDALNRDLPEGMRQGDAVAGRLAGPRRRSRRARLLAALGAGRSAAFGGALLAAAEQADRRMATRHRDVIAAFARLFGPDASRRDLAQAWLVGAGLDRAQRRAVGVLAGAPANPRAALEGVSWLMSLTGPTLCAIDQLDAVVGRQDAARERREGLIGELALGLTDLRDATRRTLTVVSTLEQTWEALRSQAVASFGARFHEPILLPGLSQPETACQLVERRLAPAFESAGAPPPYPSWPFHPAAFLGAVGYTPRDLLVRCHKHIEACLAEGAARELTTFADAGDRPGPAPSADPGPRPDQAGARFAALLAEPRPEPPDPTRLADMLLAALRAWARQAPDDEARDIELEAEPEGAGAKLRIGGPNPAQFWFRLIPHPNAIAVLARLRKALTDSGVAPDLPSRRLVVVRAAPWPSGAKTEEATRRLAALGGLTLMPDEADLRRFAAVEHLLAQPPPDLESWLRAVRPMDDSPFLRRAGLVRRAAAPAPASPPAPSLPVPPAPAPPSHDLPLGARTSDGRAASLPWAMLARHVAVIAGSGSGKTVLLRRIVEEAALAGVPAILIDSNNDLVRMADPWPAPPEAFTDEDRAKAARFHQLADVVVWTPGRAQGNPLVLAPLPDFPAVRNDPDELEAAVGMAGAALEPLLGLSGKSGGVPAGVLRDALRHLARTGPASLDALTALLRELPPEASGIGQAQKLAPRLADLLLAAQSRNPLLGQSGTPLDPAVLLGGPPGRVRVSVVNLAGLPDEETRQDFVGRLLMALFGHARRHPARGDMPVASLLVMDEAHLFAPAGRSTPSLAATRALARQARKYGLGLVFATQAPRDIDHTIVNNCSTKLIGKLNSPAAIAVATEMMGAPDDVARLTTGQFYLTTEGQAGPARIKAPLCLTHHPASPPDEAEVVSRAAASRGTAATRS